MRLGNVISSILTIAISTSASAAITGTVITTDGLPVSGAKISLFQPETFDARRARALSKTPVKPPIATVNSDSKGNFSIDSPKEPVIDLRIEAAGFAPQGERVLPDEELGALALTAAPAIKGTITAAGKPIAGAIVLIGGSGEFSATTDADGHYSAPDPAKWANRLLVIHPDFAIVDESFGPFASSKKGLDRTLVPGIAINGRVLAQDGTTPVANAQVFVDNWQLAMSGDDGTFHVLHATKDWSLVEARIDTRVGARAHTNGDIAIKLAKAASVTGVVSDAKTNVPLAGVEVRLLQNPGIGSPTIGSRSAFTNAKGAYTLIPVVPGAYQINPTRPGYLTPNVSVSVTAGQSAQKSIVANARGRVVGSVADDNKKPLAGAHLGARAAARDPMMMMMGPGMRNLGQEGVAYSGPDGRFVLRSVPTDTDIQIDATKKGYPPGHSASMRLAPSERKGGVLITLPHGVSLTGKVTDKDGKALSGVAVDAVEATNDGGFGGMRRMVVNFMQGDRNDDLVHTGSDGTFTVRVKEGTYDVVFKREGFAAKSVRGEVVSASSKPLAVTLDPGVEITGRVTRGGVGLEGVNVNAFSQDGTANAITGPDGSFRLEDLTPGSMMVSANRREDFIQQMRPIIAPAKDVVFELPAGGRITGHVVDKSSHNPITSFQAGISTSRSGGGMVFQTPPMLKSFTNDDGSFTLENVPPGQTQVVVTAPGYTASRTPGVNVEDGKTVPELEVSLDTGVKLTGRVTGPDGAPLAGVSVRPDTAAGGNRVMRFDATDTSTITDGNGDYTMDALEPGDKTFTFNRQGYLAESRPVTLSGSSARLDVQLSTGVRLTGTVSLEAGGPVADAIVSASSASDSGGFGGKQARTDASGNFQIEGLAPGHYTLNATKSGLASGILRDFDVASGMPAAIKMKSGATITGHVTGLTAQELQNATVLVSSSNGNSSAPVDSGGNYKVDGAPSGTVRVSARTGQMFGASGKSSPQKSVQVDPGASVQVDIEFKSATVVRGRVTRDGQPAANTSIIFIPKGAQSSTNASAQTDSSGNYEVSGLDDATYNVQIVDFQRAAPFTTSYDVKGSGTFDIDIKSASVRGRVLDATTGSPLADARIEIHATGGEAILSSRAVVTDSAGGFVIDNVARGNYEAKADREGYGHDIKSIVVGDSPEDLEFRLSPSGGVTITVVDARDNRTLAANVVKVVDGNGRDVDTTPTFRFSGSPEPVKLTLSPGSYNVTLSAMGYATQTVSIVSPSSPTVRMSPGGTVMIYSKSTAITRGRLIDSKGVAYSRGGFGGGIFTIDASPGVTTLQNVASGSYRLEILGSGDQVVKTVPFTVIDGQQATVPVE